MVIAAFATVLLIAGCSEDNNSAVVQPSPEVTAIPGASTAPDKTAGIQPTPDTPVSPSAAPTASPDTAMNDDPLARQIAGMTLEAKIGQMLLVGIDGTKLDESAKRMISKDEVGGIILYKDNIQNLKSMVALINDLKKSNIGNTVPLFMSVDQEGGKVSRMPAEYTAIPSNAKVGISGNADSAGMMGRLLAREVLSAGFNMDFAPVLDINSNPDNPVIGERSFGSNADIVTRLGIAEMKGMSEEGAIPVIKHFPGHGDTSVDSHLELPVVNKTAAQLAKLEWLPFQAAIQEHADAVMVAHILYPKLDPEKPASLSKTIIGNLLRGQMGFDGVVITDDLTMGAITEHYTLPAAAIDTVLAGSDVLLIAHEYANEQMVRKALINGVKKGKIPESRIDESVYRILALKEQYHLSDKPLPVPDLTALNNDIKAWLQTIKK
ncbi:beta-N-acetylhexosaminidase [Paenibacillus tianjinensis]|uniref:beta-N-acetylhexosaminidase n=2 Tax=Paenibacillus tianjinensis TaxID=2810347 RepID=A0ABX7LI41_9BACL|nr:beta-N-acetylhexosaminidase [Paenibacillus tianjinensis]